MSPSKKLIGELTEKSGPCTLKVKIVQKLRPVCSPKKTKYQRYVMQDEKGDEISATVFGDDVDMYDKTINQHGQYEISNAKIKVVKKEYQRRPGQLEMQFTPYTTIRSLFGANDGESTVNYVALSSIVPNFDTTELHDVVGIALFLEPNRTVSKKDGSGDVNVRELVLFDDSVKHPMTISVWGDLAKNECERVSSLIESPTVIGITSLRVSNYKGFSLSTSLSTQFIFDPSGEKPATLTQWAASNVDTLNSMRTRVLEARLSKIHPKLLKVVDLNSKKDDEIIAGEKVWLYGHIVEVESKGIRLYLGCDTCGQKTELDRGQQFTCKSNYCREKLRTSVPRMTLSFQFTDDTATVKLSAFTEDAQKILDTSADHMYGMGSEERDHFLREIGVELVKKAFYVEVAPAPGLVISHMLRWLLKRVSFDRPQGL